nr:MAG TPA: hypothetical protein [Caudoviricetes sp.]
MCPGTRVAARVSGAFYFCAAISIVVGERAKAPLPFKPYSHLKNKAVNFL